MPAGGFPNTFTDFLEATRDLKVTSRETLLNEMTLNTYFIKRMVEDRSVRQTFQGGSRLVEKIQGAENGSFAFISPNDEQSPVQTPTLKEIKVDWALAKSDYSYNDVEVGTNEGDPNRFVDLKRAYEQGCVVDTVNGMERALWTLPHSENMEAASADPRHAYSILAYVTRDGLEPSSTNGGIATGSTAFTTIATVNPSTDTWYQNKFGSYTAATPDDPDAGLVAAMDDIVLQTMFEMPSGLKKYSEDKGLQKQVIVTSRDGVTFFKARLRSLNDRMEQLRDPAINGPQFSGVPVTYVSELDNAGWTDNQPDYLTLNLGYFFPVFRDGWYMFERPTDGGAKQPLSHTVYKFSQFNLFCRSRRRQGRVFAA